MWVDLSFAYTLGFGPRDTLSPPRCRWGLARGTLLGGSQPQGIGRGLRGRLVGRVEAKGGRGTQREPHKDQCVGETSPHSLLGSQSLMTVLDTVSENT